MYFANRWYSAEAGKHLDSFNDFKLFLSIFFAVYCKKYSILFYVFLGY